MEKRRSSDREASSPRSERSLPFGPMRRPSKALMALIEAATAESGQTTYPHSNREDDASSRHEVHENAASYAKVTPTTLASLSHLSHVDTTTGGRTVAELRPRPGLLISTGTTVADAARKMRSMNVDVALIIAGEDGALKGIMTDTDITRKLLALGNDPELIVVESIMTPEPHCVSSSATAVSALCTMMDRRIRHLPVVNASFQVQGVLDVAKCLHDAVSRIDSISIGKSVKLGSLLQSPSPLSTGGSRERGNSVAASATVREAAALMNKKRSGLLVEAPGRACVGIITPKDLLFRVVAVGLSARSTIVSPSIQCMSMSTAHLTHYTTQRCTVFHTTHSTPRHITRTHTTITIQRTPCATPHTRHHTPHTEHLSPHISLLSPCTTHTTPHHT